MALIGGVETIILAQAQRSLTPIYGIHSQSRINSSGHKVSRLENREAGGVRSVGIPSSAQIFVL